MLALSKYKNSKHEKRHILTSHKTTIGFWLAFIGMILLSSFIYAGYPTEWRNNLILNTILLLQHAIGGLSLSAIFIYYKKISSKFLRQAISKYGSIYYVFMINMAVITAIKFILRLAIDVGLKSKQFSFEEFIENDHGYELFGMLLAYLIAFIGFFNANHTRIKKHSIAINKKSELDVLNITLIADMHIGSGTWTNTFDKLIKLIEYSKPDIILIAGDMIDETTSDADIENLKRLTETLCPKFGTYFVYGNHDITRPEYIEIIKKQTNIKILSDEKVMIHDIQLIGRPDYKSKHILPENMNEYFEIDPSKPVIILQHRPNEFLKLDEQNYDLVVAGHTHGFNFAQSINVGITSDLIQGIRKYKNLTAVVTSGVAGWGFHYKFPATSEIVNIKLRFDGHFTKNDK